MRIKKAILCAALVLSLCGISVAATCPPGCVPAPAGKAPVLSGMLASTARVDILSTSSTAHQISYAKAADGGQLSLSIQIKFVGSGGLGGTGSLKLTMGSSIGKKKSDGTYYWNATITRPSINKSGSWMEYDVIYTISNANGGSTSVTKRYRITRNL